MTRALALLLALGLVLAGCSDVPHAGQPARTQLTSTDVGADSQPDEAGQEAASENRQQPPERASGQRSAKDLEQTATREGITKAKVIRVVDGDTIEVQYIIGSVLPATRVRMIGVDTPEVHGQKEPYGPEASEFTKRQLTGRTVWLEKDVSETDRYGRVLRYVWLIDPPADPTETQIREGLFNAILVLKGYAQVATYPPDVRYADLLVTFQREARNADRGLWGLGASSGNESTGGSPRPGTSGGRSSRSSSGSTASKTARKCDPAYPDVCIPPPPPDLDCGDIPHRDFRVLPPDPHRLDGRDNDGIACES